MTRITAALLLAFTLSAAARAQTAAAKPGSQGASQDEAAVRAVVKGLEDGWNAHDGKAFAAGFAADADYVVVNGMYLKGRDAIEQGHAQIFSTFYKESRNAATLKGVRFVRPDVAVAHVEWNLEGGPGGQKGRALSTLVLTKDGGKWSIAAFHNTPITQGGGRPAQEQQRP
ncbi:MAG TPA: SgcJ/EcaC family oxidoreductase [Pyrinomonadaceae bacterium]|jgi:uncharacterized protein (TIGR02246 family)